MSDKEDSANVLYWSMIAKDMPCSREKVVNCEDATAVATTLLRMVAEETFLGSVQCKVFILQKLWF